MDNESQKAFVEGIQAIIKAKQEGFAEYQQSINKNNQNRIDYAFKHSQMNRDSGSSGKDQKESAGFSREAQSLMGC